VIPAAARRHALLLGVLAAGLVLRLAISVAYPEGFVSSEDAFTYLGLSWDAPWVEAVPDRPAGYGFFIELVSLLGNSLTWLVTVQHLIGLAIGAVAYALLLRLGSGRWVAAAAAAILVLDSYLVTAEHWALTETATTGLVFAALALTAASRRAWALALAGALLGSAVTMRTAAAFAIPVWLGYLLWQRRDWRLAVPATVAVAVLPLAHMVWYEGQTGEFAMSKMDGWFLYARVAKIGTCGHADIPKEARPMCPLLLDPPQDPRTALWGGVASPAHQVFGGPTTDGLEADPILRRYALAIVRDRPFTYTRMVGRDLLRYFEPGRDEVGLPQLSRMPPPLPPTHLGVRDSLLPGFEPRSRAPDGALEVYGDVVHLPRPLLGVAAALAGLLALLAIRGPLRDWVPRRAEALLLLGAGGALLLGATATSGYIWRYLLPSIPALVSGALVVGEDVARRALSARRAHQLEPVEVAAGA
jgi:Dolichyl-phosphate-mannose-protein mannosyltransferase